MLFTNNENTLSIKKHQDEKIETRYARYLRSIKSNKKGNYQLILERTLNSPYFIASKNDMD